MPMQTPVLARPAPMTLGREPAPPRDPLPPFSLDRVASLVPPPLLVVAAIVLIQAGAATSKGLMTADNAMGVVWLRNLGALLILLAVARPDLTALTRRQWLDALGLGVALALFNSIFYLAIPRVPIGLVVTIGFLGPLLLGLLGARRLIDYLWPALALGGVMLITPWTGGSHIDPIGLLLAFAYAGAWIAYILFSGRSGRSLPGLLGLTLGMAGSTLMLTPFGWSAAQGFLAQPDTLPLIGLVSLFTVLPFALEYMALKRMKPSLYGVIVATEPAIAALVALLMLGEGIGVAGWIALAAVSIAAVGATLTRAVETDT
ncbi:MAG: DMT family transporter [Parvibaculaceae bacterium]